MKRPLAALLLSATILTGYLGYAAADARAQSPASAPKPTFGDFGVDEAGMDTSIAPGDDFYGYVNGIWAKNTPIPADKANFGAFDALQDLSRERTHDILEAQRADPKSKIGAAYAGLSRYRRDRGEGSDADQTLARPDQRADEQGGLCRAHRRGRPPTASAPRSALASRRTPRTLNIMRFEIDQGGLGLPERDYYLNVNPKLEAAKTAYRAHIVRMLTLAGEPGAEARAAAIVDFETDIAKASWTKIQNRDADATYNKMGVAALTKAAPGFDFVTYFAISARPVDSVIVGQPSAVTAIAAR